MSTTLPEYFQLFSNAGEVTVKVKFVDRSDKGRSIATCTANWPELARLYDGENKIPYKKMYFDSYLCPVEMIEVRPSCNLVVIHVGKTGLPSVG